MKVLFLGAWKDFLFLSFLLILAACPNTTEPLTGDTGKTGYTISGKVSLNPPDPDQDMRKISVRLKQGNAWYGNAVSPEADGSYSITKIQPGTYSIEASLSGYLPASLSITVQKAGLAGKNLTLQGIAASWSDEFEGSSLDSSKWNIETGNGSQYGNDMYGWGNAEKQLFTSENISVSEGVLRIEVKKDTGDGNYPYSSARITTGKIRASSGGAVTAAKHTVRKGRVEARMKLPVGQGFWPAFWLLGINSYMNSSNQNQSTWPACGEIDIAEMQGGLNDKRLLGTIHFGTAYPDSHYSLGAGITHGENLGNGWHVYGVSWDEAGVRWTFDGEEYGSTSFNPLPGTDGNGKPIDTSLANTGAFTAQTGFAVILNLAVGGNFFGDPNTLPPDSILNDPDKRDERSLLVDWVRVYEE